MRLLSVDVRVDVGDGILVLLVPLGPLVRSSGVPLAADKIPCSILLLVSCALVSSRDGCYFPSSAVPLLSDYYSPSPDIFAAVNCPPSSRPVSTVSSCCLSTFDNNRYLSPLVLVACCAYASGRFPIVSSSLRTGLRSPLSNILPLLTCCRSRAWRPRCAPVLDPCPLLFLCSPVPDYCCPSNPAACLSQS